MHDSLLTALVREVTKLRSAIRGAAGTSGALAGAARLCWLDWAAVAFYGLSDRIAQAVLEAAGGRECVLRPFLEGLDEGKRYNDTSAPRIRSGKGSPLLPPQSLQLALLLGVAAHATEMDDTLSQCMVHAGAPVIAAAVATGASLGVSGEAFLRAVAVGYEVVNRVGRAVNATPRMAVHARGFHPTGVVGTLGAAAAAAELLGLNEDGMAAALALATSMGSGLLEFFSGGADTKALHAGKAAADGVLAASLAARGLRGPLTALEGRDGFFRAFGDGQPDVERVVEPFRVESAAVLHTRRKYFACCHHCQPTVEALARLRARRPFEPYEVTSVEAVIPSMAAYQVAVPETRKRRPATRLEAQLSLPYSVAGWLVLGHLAPHAFDRPHLDDPHILRLADRVRVTTSQQIDRSFADGRMPAEVTVRLADGSTLTECFDCRDASVDMASEEQRVRRKAMSLLEHLADITGQGGMTTAERLWGTFESVCWRGPRVLGEALDALLRACRTGRPNVLHAVEGGSQP